MKTHKKKATTGNQRDFPPLSVNLTAGARFTTYVQGREQGADSKCPAHLPLDHREIERGAVSGIRERGV